jgi:nitrite reductase (NADH) large subunit
MGLFEVTVFGEEPRPAYDRVHLSEYFSGKTARDLTLAPFQWYEDNNINLYLNDRVADVHRTERYIVSEKGRRLEYDILVLATGSAPFVPPVPGIDKKGVFVYRTIDDLEAITAYAKTVKSAAVIGGGLLGLEAAKAAADLRLKTHVIEFAPRLMPRQVDQAGSDFLKKKIEELGVGVFLNKNTKEIRGEHSVMGIDFADGNTLDVDMIVVSAGIRPRDEIARACGLEVGARGGIVVDEYLRTSDPNIYAIGECALFGGMIYGLVAPGYQMADKLAANLSGDTKKFTGADMSTKLKLMGVDVASFGDPFVQGASIAEVVLADAVDGTYKKILMDKDSKTIVGGVLVGDASDYGRLLQMYQNKMSVSQNPCALLVKKEEVGAQADDLELPESTHICSCENITKGVIVAAVANGAKTVCDIKKATKAATGCGGCAPLITSIIQSELRKSGVSVDTSLCEHFSFTRRELAALIQKDKVKSF